MQVANLTPSILPIYVSHAPSPSGHFVIPTSWDWCAWVTSKGRTPGDGLQATLLRSALTPDPTFTCWFAARLTQRPHDYRCTASRYDDVEAPDGGEAVDPVANPGVDWRGVDCMSVFPLMIEAALGGSVGVGVGVLAWIDGMVYKSWLLGVDGDVVGSVGDRGLCCSCWDDLTIVSVDGGVLPSIDVSLDLIVRVFLMTLLIMIWAELLEWMVLSTGDLAVDHVVGVDGDVDSGEVEAALVDNVVDGDVLPGDPVVLQIGSAAGSL
ncbi:hypothetical protein BDK51DRAFT_48085 [Blyttiomyces helicus]|uniref:Uncharacterized protein n=1 Tax=Blyttiomyces helicus TaxID=388810 RepID=A0A4P9WT08_9FUNG|nr:hypothetical protein BDK51DRAFT_48085 [Blyttiomyces helicus]|eukprot:RKO94460.1 hypothetical protein BDK51DRAFT_48085 [Blyttiomyces helicus]